ncbi:MAG: methyl-accepting chemotaxis protein [Eubacterium sp.]|jgi:methyl-accepting chemotaxis protein|nr:methyl-accepting chemotaxis protein [Eubacterium sp.]
MRKTSLKTTILFPALAMLITGVIALTATVGFLASSSTDDLTGRLINSSVSEYSNKFEALCKGAYSIVNSAAPVVDSVAMGPKSEDKRAKIVDILSDILMSDENLLGVWTCWEPNALDNKDSEYINANEYHDETGRFIPYVTRNGNGYALEPLANYTVEGDGDFYLGARNSGRPYITDPFPHMIEGKETLLYSIAVPIVHNGRVSGVVGADITLEKVTEIMNSESILDDGYIFVISPGGFYASHIDENLIMKHYSTQWLNKHSAAIEGILTSGGSIEVKDYSDISKENVRLLMSGVMVGNTGKYWGVCGLVPEDTATAASNTLIWIVISLGFALIIAVGTIILIIVRKSLKELPLLTSAAEAIAVGDIESVNLKVEKRKAENELIALKHAFIKMIDGIRFQAESMSQMADGDYSLTVLIRSEKDVVNRAINNMLFNTNSALQDVSAAANQVQAGSKQIADGAQALAKGSAKQAETIEQLAASASSIAEKTRSNAKMANKADLLADTIKSDAEKGSAQMSEMMKAVNEISDASGQIEKVIKVIDDIAFQTNILALNAAVEAARAGEAGKGFAVVAEEVRNLASKSAEAAKNTGGLIENSIQKANLGLSIAGETSVSLNEIVEGINESAEIVRQMAILSDEQASAISEVNAGINQVAQVIQQNSATAEQSSAAGEKMSEQSDMLSELTSRFKLRSEADNNFNQFDQGK